MILNYLLLITFITTNMVPLTGIAIHKLSSVLFLMLCMIHTVKYRKKLQGKRVVMLGMIVLAFVSGLFGMIFDEIPLIMALHKVISIGSIFALAIHIFVFHKRIRKKK